MFLSVCVYVLFFFFILFLYLRLYFYMEWLKGKNGKLGKGGVRAAYELGAIPIMRTGHFCLYDLFFFCFSFPVFYGLVRKE